jgi:hypothetical protein
MGTTRFPNGVTNATPSGVLGAYPALDPTKCHVFFDDFDRYVVGDWTLTTTEAGAGDATEALAAGDGGLLLITNDAADNDLDFFQKVGASFKMAAGKKAWFKARFKVSDATQSDIVMGLQVVDSTPLAVTDGIWFRKDDGDALIDFVCQKDDTSGKTTSTGIATLVDDTFIVLGWYYNGVDAVEAFVNDVKVATLSATSAYLPDTDLTVSFGIQNGEAVAKTMTVDYVFAAKER